MKKIVICADDYGISPGVSQAILKLIKKKIVTATGCITIMPEWAELAQDLNVLKFQPDIGVHLCLTDMGLEFNGKKLPNFNHLFIKAIASCLDPKSISSIIEHQLDLFELYINKAPDFIDGHQYVHQFPIIRDVLIDIINKRYKIKTPYVRNTDMKFSNICKMDNSRTKNLFIAYYGRIFKKQLMKKNIITNSSFSGIYDFRPNSAYRSCFKKFLEIVDDNGIIVTHPGHVDTLLLQRDKLTLKREEEFAFLESSEFRQLMRSKKIDLTRFST